MIRASVRRARGRRGGPRVGRRVVHTARIGLVVAVPAAPNHEVGAGPNRPRAGSSRGPVASGRRVCRRGRGPGVGRRVIASSGVHFLARDSRSGPNDQLGSAPSAGRSERRRGGSGRLHGRPGIGGEVVNAAGVGVVTAVQEEFRSRESRASGPGRIRRRASRMGHRAPGIGRGVENRAVARVRKLGDVVAAPNNHFGTGRYHVLHQPGARGARLVDQRPGIARGVVERAVVLRPAVVFVLSAPNHHARSGPYGVMPVAARRSVQRAGRGPGVRKRIVLSAGFDQAGHSVTAPNDHLRPGPYRGLVGADRGGADEGGGHPGAIEGNRRVGSKVGVARVGGPRERPNLEIVGGSGLQVAHRGGHGGRADRGEHDPSALVRAHLNLDSLGVDRKVVEPAEQDRIRGHRFRVEVERSAEGRRAESGGFDVRVSGPACAADGGDAVIIGRAFGQSGVGVGGGRAGEVDVVPAVVTAVAALELHRVVRTLGYLPRQIDTERVGGGRQVVGRRHGQILRLSGNRLGIDFAFDRSVVSDHSKVVNGTGGETRNRAREGIGDRPRREAFRPGVSAARFTDFDPQVSAARERNVEFDLRVRYHGRAVDDRAGGQRAAVADGSRPNGKRARGNPGGILSVRAVGAYVEGVIVTRPETGHRVGGFFRDGRREQAVGSSYVEPVPFFVDKVNIETRFDVRRVVPGEVHFAFVVTLRSRHVRRRRGGGIRAVQDVGARFIREPRCVRRAGDHRAGQKAVHSDANGFRAAIGGRRVGGATRSRADEGSHEGTLHGPVRVLRIDHDGVFEIVRIVRRQKRIGHGVLIRFERDAEPAVHDRGGALHLTGRRRGRAVVEKADIALVAEVVRQEGDVGVRLRHEHEYGLGFRPENSRALRRREDRSLLAGRGARRRVFSSAVEARNAAPADEVGGAGNVVLAGHVLAAAVLVPFPVVVRRSDEVGVGELLAAVRPGDLNPDLSLVIRFRVFVQHRVVRRGGSYFLERIDEVGNRGHEALDVHAHHFSAVLHVRRQKIQGLAAHGGRVELERNELVRCAKHDRGESGIGELTGERNAARDVAAQVGQVTGDLNRVLRRMVDVGTAHAGKGGADHECPEKSFEGNNHSRLPITFRLGR